MASPEAILVKNKDIFSIRISLLFYGPYLKDTANYPYKDDAIESILVKYLFIESFKKA